jgi:hypothetical protein
VDLVEVDVIRAEPAQAGVDLGENRLARRAKSLIARPRISSLLPSE